MSSYDEAMWEWVKREFELTEPEREKPMTYLVVRKDEWAAGCEREDVNLHFTFVAELVQVGWWHWWDGDLSKSGAFRYDHPERGVSKPAYLIQPREEQ